MSDFEHDHTRWLDGQMSESERRQFEASLDAAALEEGQAWRALKQVLVRRAREIETPSADFFNAGILLEIEREVRPVREEPRRRFSLVWAGAACLAAAALLSAVGLPGALRTRSEADFVSQVVSARAANPEISAYAFQAPDQRGAVIWMEGTDYIPGGERVR